MKNTIPLNPLGSLSRTSRWANALLPTAASVVAVLLCVTSNRAHAQILAWDFTGETTLATSVAEVKNTDLSASTGTLTRGSGAMASAGVNSFRTLGFKNDGIATNNEDYFQTTLTAAQGFALSLSTIDARFAGTSSFFASPGASNQFAYSLNGITFTLIGSPTVVTSSGAIPQISVAGITDLQNVPASTTITIRFYASGQTITGGWGFNSASSGQYGLAFGGTVAEAGLGVDVTPPSISALTPSNDDMVVAPTTEIVAVFSEPVQAGIGDIRLEKTSDNSIVSSSTVISASTLTITPSTDLEYATSYTVVIPPGAITDSSNNPFGGIPETASWTFTTKEQDLTAPLALSFAPAPGSENIAIPAFLTITFDEAVQVPILEALVTVKDSAGNAVAQMDTSIFGGTAIISGASGNVATINLPAEAGLKFGTSYYVEVAEGAFEDLAGNPFAGISLSTTWTFTTVDVPNLTGDPYTQDFSTYTSAETLPSGWSAKGGPGYLSGYEGDWGTISQGGFRGNASVIGYHHTSQSGTVDPPLEKILTLRNVTGAVITDLTVTYKGRAALPQNTRLPAYTVSVAGVSAGGLSYTTLDPDNSQRNVSVGGLSIAEGDTFQIKWVSNYPTGGGSARQIGISDVFVNAASSLFAPSVARLNIPSLTIAPTAATAQAEVLSDGGQAITARGFVYSETSINSAPEIGGTGVISTTDDAPTVGAFSKSFTNLTAATSYTVSAYATNSSGTSYTSPVAFTTLATPPTFVSSYTQQFANYDGINPGGWTALSDANPPVQGYGGGWGTGTSGGFRGGDSNPGVLGYQHVASSGSLTVTLRLINGTGAPITTLNVGYLGRSQRRDQPRSPKWEVSVAGSDPVVALEYVTGPEDVAKSAEVTGLNIAAGAEFSITWTCDRGFNTIGGSKQIGLADVYVGLEPPVLNTYANWATTNVGGQGPSLDFDGDGVPNGVEYFMGSSPTAFTATPGILAGAVMWPRAADTTISSFTVEVSTNLSTWEDATVDYAANLNITASEVVFSMPAGPTKLFVRLNVVP